LSEGDEDFGELANQFRQLAERFHRLAVVAFDLTSSAAFKQWGDDLMAQAAALDQAKGTPEGGSDKG
jgi:aminoglycoside phosphotransferase